MRIKRAFATGPVEKRAYKVQVKFSLKDKLRLLFSRVRLDIEFHEFLSANNITVIMINRRGYLAGMASEDFPLVGNVKRIR
jgi:hypothetical protein